MVKQHRPSEKLHLNDFRKKRISHPPSPEANPTSSSSSSSSSSADLEETDSYSFTRLSTSPPPIDETSPTLASNSNSNFHNISNSNSFRPRCQTQRVARLLHQAQKTGKVGDLNKHSSLDALPEDIDDVSFNKASVANLWKEMDKSIFAEDGDEEEVSFHSVANSILRSLTHSLTNSLTN